MIYLWRTPETYPDSKAGIYDEDRSPDRFLFMNGRPVLESLPPIYMKIAATKAWLQRYDCLPSTAASPIVNARVREIIATLANDDVQYFDVILQTLDGDLFDYKLLNITNTVYAIDHELSDYSVIANEGGTVPDALAKISVKEKKGFIIRFHYLALKEHGLQHHAIVRDEEDQVTILVSDQLVHQFNIHRIKGVKFETLHEFNARLYPRPKPKNAS